MASRSADSISPFAAGMEYRTVIAQPGPDAVDDASLVDSARRGDRSAFGHLYERYARMVHGVLLAKVPVAAVDDLVQDVFVRALRHLASLRQNENFGAWLRTIARNLANDFHRQAVPECEFTDNTLESDPVSEPAEIDLERPATAILEAIRSLPDAYRETLILRLVEGMTGPEIAARTGLTHGSVRVNLHRGMQQLRARLAPRAAESREQEPL